jgi:hypothetical protein
MVLETGKPQPLTFRGEVVEIFEKQGLRFAKIKFEPFSVLDVAAECFEEAHLGDGVVIDARITIDKIKPE